MVDSHSARTQLDFTELLDNKINKKSLLLIPFSISSGMDCPPTISHSSNHGIHPASFKSEYSKFANPLSLEE